MRERENTKDERTRFKVAMSDMKVKACSEGNLYIELQQKDTYPTPYIAPWKSPQQKAQTSSA